MSKEIKQKILETWLDNIAFDGITKQSLYQSAEKLGHKPEIIDALFPGKTDQALQNLSQLFDEHMIKSLRDIDIEKLKIRERIQTATMARINLMNEHKESYHKITSYWAHPLKLVKAKKILWHSADTIWKWAGDTSNDYNHYTKRGLLSSILSVTYIYWLQDSNQSLKKTEDFLNRRIENALTLGTLINKTKNKLPIV